MLRYFQELVKDDDGHPSSLRMVFLVGGMSFVLCVVFVWTYVSLYNRAMSEIPSGIAEILGTLLVGKALQKGVEVFGEIKKKPLDNNP